jgi:hypothetical protein
LSRTHHSLKPRSGAKEKVVKIERCVVDLHVFMLGAIKISRFFFSRQTSTTTFIGFFIKLMLVSWPVSHLSHLPQTLFGEKA